MSSNNKQRQCVAWGRSSGYSTLAISKRALLLIRRTRRCAMRESRTSLSSPTCGASTTRTVATR